MQSTANAVLALAEPQVKLAFPAEMGDCVVLAHCVNPDCRVALRSFSEGRLFQFEVVSISVAASDDTRLPFDEKPKRQTSHFWLCGNCSAKMSVTLEPLLGLKLIPLVCGDADPVDTGNVSSNDSRTCQPNPC